VHIKHERSKSFSAFNENVFQRQTFFMILSFLCFASLELIVDGKLSESLHPSASSALSVTNIMRLKSKVDGQIHDLGEIYIHAATTTTTA